VLENLNVLVNYLSAQTYVLCQCIRMDCQRIHLKNYSVNFPILNLQDDQCFIKKSLEDSEQVQVKNHNTNAW
jgi:hypothetical protein